MIYLFIFIAGACIGSFINVILSRRDWYKGRSRCDSCGHILSWYELIPIVSWIIQGGRCRKCKEKVGIEHLVSEIYMGCALLCASLCFLKYGLYYGALFLIGLFFLCLFAIQDMKEKMVYAFLLYAGILITAAIKLMILFRFFEIWDVWIFICYLGAIKFLGWLFAFVTGQKIGAGDFDIILMLYILFGSPRFFYVIIFACMIGTLVYLPAVITKKYDRREAVPLAPLFYIASIVFVLGGVFF